MKNKFTNSIFLCSLIMLLQNESKCMNLLTKKLIISSKTNLQSKSYLKSQKRNFIDDIEFRYKQELYKKIKDLQKIVGDSIPKGIIVSPDQFGITYGTRSKIEKWEEIEEKQKRELESIHKYIREYMLQENINPEKTEHKNSSKTDISGQIWCPAHPHWPHSSDFNKDTCTEKNCCKKEKSSSRSISLDNGYKIDEF